uniref:Transmembrane protein n=1 Tax=Pithovirus LCPAC103 TaxID=2506588 RepID=A0A481Z4H6_9VIRU|nr:MAG: transmembrane protein [Pithovirus LCPAC103]
MTTLISCNRLKPDTSNICTDELPSSDPKHRDKGFATRTVPNSCTCFSYNNAFTFARAICDLVGQNEWILTSKHKHFPKCDPANEEFANGCGHCRSLSSESREINCSRIAYLGASTACCLRDFDFDRINQFCFDNIDEKRTCTPFRRNITTEDCQLDVASFCSGGDLPFTSTAWFERWIEPSEDTRGLPPCIYALNRNLFGNPYTPSVASGTPPGGEFFINVEGFNFGRDLLTEVFIKYNDLGFEIGASPGFPGYNDFQNTLYTICRTVPGLCNPKLPSICNDITTEDLTINPALISWCGCYMPDAEYQTFVDDFGITKECTPMCSQINAIKLATPSQTDVLRCKQNICIMDDITIALAESQIEGSINFVQLCGNCSGQSSCQCVISNVDIEIINSRLEGDVNITQLCGQATCVRTNPDETGSPRTLPVNCENPADNPFEQFENDMISAAEFKETMITLAIIVGFLLFVIVVFILAVFY